ncbi:HAD family hydrolase [Streptomyces broussonetiae]|uniref:HAD-IA family hydrolase n=1 Tax=Streptomyces broussonetiae TaxID=2686304 RepID=A0ABV5EE49_9ACTN
MTDDDRRAWDLLSSARCVLFDFDGPLCRLFPDGSSETVARAVRDIVDKFALGDVLTEYERTSIDPHVVLRAVHGARHQRDVSEVAGLMEAAVTAGELDAVRTALPTGQADDVVRLLAQRGVRLAVVTNNAAGAAVAYLDGRRLLDRFASLQGRTGDPALMKPHPDVVVRALHALALDPADAVMIGDAGTDVEAARRAGVAFIGYGRNEDKVRRLRAAGADVVLTSYDGLVTRGRSG